MPRSAERNGSSLETRLGWLHIFWAILLIELQIFHVRPTYESRQTHKRWAMAICQSNDVGYLVLKVKQSLFIVHQLHWRTYWGCDCCYEEREFCSSAPFVWSHVLVVSTRSYYVGSTVSICKNSAISYLPMLRVVTRVVASSSGDTGAVELRRTGPKIWTKALAVTASQIILLHSLAFQTTLKFVIVPAHLLNNHPFHQQAHLFRSSFDPLRILFRASRQTFKSLPSLSTTCAVECFLWRF